ILVDAGLVVLDGETCELRGVGVAGVKGFGGGFGCRALGPWGETIIKQFVHEAVDEALEIYPFLGSSRLEEPIGRYPVSFVLHGHAHRGQLEGKTQTGVPVYNVSMPLLTRTFAERPPFRVFELPADEVPNTQ